MKGGATDNTTFPGQSETNTVGDKTTTGAVDKFESYWDENFKKCIDMFICVFILTVEKM